MIGFVDVVVIVVGVVAVDNAVERCLIRRLKQAKDEVKAVEKELETDTQLRIWRSFTQTEPRPPTGRKRATNWQDPIK